MIMIIMMMPMMCVLVSTENGCAHSRAAPAAAAGQPERQEHTDRAFFAAGASFNFSLFFGTAGSGVYATRCMQL